MGRKIKNIKKNIPYMWTRPKLQIWKWQFGLLIAPHYPFWVNVLLNVFNTKCCSVKNYYLLEIHLNICAVIIFLYI